MPLRPAISFIIPVYNKADVLPFVLRALASQNLGQTAEYVFVDDASQDGSASVIERLAECLGSVQVIRNAENAGPSIRLNQGAQAASGRYFCLLDADELIAPNAVQLMLDLLRAERADMIHGKVIRSSLQAADIQPDPVRHNPPYAASATPLDMMLQTRGLVRMAWLVEADLFRAAAGCDERIFIQDEALPLRLAAKARRMIDLQAGVTYAPRASYRLSADKRQQHHDRFFAYYHALKDNPQLNAAQRRRMIGTCLSVAWKSARNDELPGNRFAAFRSYLASKLGWPQISDAALEPFASAFRSMGGIRRMQVSVNEH